MNNVLGSVVAVALGLACSSSRALAEYFVVNAPTTKLGPADADLIHRGTQAFLRYLAACSQQDLPALKKTVTEDAVLEYALKKWGTYLSVGAKGVGSYCDIAPGKTPIAELSVYPTNTAGVLLVNYELKSDRRARTAQVSEHLVLLEIRQESIIRICDFSATSNDRRRLIAHHASVSGAK
jgi:hypothetical protein